jgi:hypothetical protein
MPASWRICVNVNPRAPELAITVGLGFQLVERLSNRAGDPLVRRPSVQSVGR